MAPIMDEKPKEGDMIEIFRGRYQHWALYFGHGLVIHLAPPSEVPGSGLNSMRSVYCEKAKVKLEEMSVVVGDDNWCVNNQLDKKYQVRPIDEILRDARSYVNRTLPYCVFSQNCEHFVTELRYGKAESRQVRQAVEINAAVGVGLLAIGAIGAIVALVAAGKKKNKEEKY